MHPTIAWTPAEPGGENRPIVVRKDGSLPPVSVQLIDLEGQPVTLAGVTVFFELYTMGEDAVTAEFTDGNPTGHTWQVQAVTDASGVATSQRIDVGSEPGYLSLRAVCERDRRQTTLTRDLRIVADQITLTPTLRSVAGTTGNPVLPPIVVLATNAQGQPVPNLPIRARIEEPLAAFGGQPSLVLNTQPDGTAQFIPVAGTQCGDTRVQLSLAGPDAGDYEVNGASVALRVEPAGSAGEPTQLLRLHDQDMIAPAGGTVGELLYQVRDACDRPVSGVVARVYNLNSVSPSDGSPRPASRPPQAKLPQRTDQFSQPIPANFGGPVAAARAFHTTTLFEPGKALIVGGSTKHGATASNTAQANLAPTALVIDFNACATQGLAGQRPRKDHTATLLQNGTVLIVGGVDSAGAIVPSQIYDPSTGALTDAPAPQAAFPRHSHSAIPFGSGVLLVGGLDATGTRVRRAELLGPTGASVSSFDLPDEDRVRPALVVFQKRGSAHDQKVLVIGGAGASPPTTVLSLDVSGSSVTPLQQLPEVAAGTPLLARAAVGLARDERDQDQGKVLVVGDNGAAIFDPEVSFSLSDFSGDSTDPAVKSFGGSYFGLARVPSALPSSGLDRILLTNDRGDALFYSRDDLGVQTNSRFFATAAFSGADRATGYTVTALTRNSGYERTLGSALVLGGASAIAPDDANEVRDDAIAFVAPSARLTGPGTGGGAFVLTLVSDAAGLFRISTATLETNGGRHTIRIETTPAPGANKLVSFTNLYAKDPFKKSPQQGNPSGGGGGGGEPPPPPPPPPPTPPPGGGSLPLFSLDCPCKGGESELALHIPEGVLAEKVELITVAINALGSQSGPEDWLEAVCAPGFQPGDLSGHGITISTPQPTDLAGDPVQPEEFVRLDTTLSAEFPAGSEIALSRIVGGIAADPDACPTRHLHGTFNPATGKREIFIDDKGPFVDPNPGVCGFGSLFTSEPQSNAPAQPTVTTNAGNSRITVTNPSSTEPLRPMTFKSKVRTTSGETLIGVVMKVTDFDGNETFCPLVTSARCVDIEINSGQPLLLDRGAISAGIAAAGGDMGKYAKNPACYTWVSGTYVHNTPELQIYIDEFPSEAIWAQEPDPCCLVVLETTEHFVFDNGKRRKVLLNSCNTSPYRIKEALIPVGPVSDEACVRAFLIPRSAAGFFTSGFQFVVPFLGTTISIPPPPLSGEPCDEACTCLLGGQIWICDKDKTSDDVVVTSDQNDTLAEFGNVPCPGEKKQCKEPNTLVIQLDGDEECCVPVEVRIQNTGGGKASFQPCEEDLVVKVSGCGGAKFKIPFWGLRESCEKGDVKISLSVGSSTAISVGGGGFSAQGAGEEFPCLNKPCPPTVEATVLGIRSQVCATPDPCDDLVPLPVGTNPAVPTELNVCLIGPSGCTYDICVDQSGGGAVAFSLSSDMSGASGSLLLPNVQAIPPAHCGALSEAPAQPENATRTRSPGPGATHSTTRKQPSPCPANHPLARKVYMVGTSKSGAAFDTAVNLRVKILDTPCPDEASTPQRSSRPVTGSSPQVPSPPLVSVAAAPPTPIPGKCLLSRCEDITVPLVSLEICGSPGDDDDLGCANPSTQVPIAIKIDPSIKDKCPGAKPFTLEYASTIGGTLTPGGSPQAVGEETAVAATGFTGPSGSADDQEVVLKRDCGGVIQELARDDFTVLQGTLTLPECVCESVQTLPYTFRMAPTGGWDAGRTFEWTFAVTSGNVLMGGGLAHTITMNPGDVVTQNVVSGAGMADDTLNGSRVEARTAICGTLQGCGSDTTTVVGVEVEKPLPNNCLSKKNQPRGQVVFRLKPQRIAGCDFDVDLKKGEDADQALDSAESGAIAFTVTQAGNRITVDLTALDEIGGKREFKLRCFNVAEPACFRTATILFGDDYGEKPPRNCNPGDPAGLSAGDAKGSPYGDTNDSADPVDLGRGELTLTRVDMVIPGRGMDFRHIRTYRSRSDRDTSQGYGWDFNFNTRLPQLDPGNAANRSRVLIEGGTSIASAFGAAPNNGFETPAQLFAELREITPGVFRILDRDGTARFFDNVGHLTRVVDLHGNTMEFFYGTAGDPSESRDLLTKVRDTLGRDIRYVYYPGNIGGGPRLRHLIDFTGRQVTYTYTSNGDLESVTSPRVLTPAFNQFPNGKTERYTYLSGQGVPELNHNLEKIIRPNQNVTGSEQGATDGTPVGTEVTRVTYDALDRVKTEFWGSGTVTYNYLTGPSAEEPATATHDAIVRKTQVTDRNGNLTEYGINGQSAVTVKREFVGGGKVFETHTLHDRNNQVIRHTLPRGSATVRVYDDGMVPLPSGGGAVFDARLTANAIVTLVIPATGTDAEGGYTIENDQEFLIQAAVWDNVYNQPCIQFEPRAFATAAELGTVLPSGIPQSQRYASRIFFDYEEGDRAQQINRLATKLGTTPAFVTGLLDRNPSRVIPQIEAAIQSLTGRTVSVVPPELPSTLADPTDFNEDGVTDRVVGDHLLVLAPRVTLVDEQVTHGGYQGAALQESYTTTIYNTFGQPTATTNAEGNTTAFVYFAATNPTGATGGAADVLRPGADPNTGGHLKEVVVDTLLPLATPKHASRRRAGAASATNLKTQFTYNRRGAQTSITDSRGNTSTTTLNELDQVVQSFSRAPYRFETRYVFDANDNVVEVHVEDRRAKTAPWGGPVHDAQNNVLMGASNGFFVHTTTYNILDNVIQSTQDARLKPGDPAQDLVSSLTRDPNQNPLVTTHARGNQTSRTYDARDQVLTVSTGLGAGSVPGEVSTVAYAYDANRSQRENTDAEGGDVVRIEYDGFGRLKRTIDPLGNETVHYHDARGNMIRQVTLGQVRQGTGSNVVLSETFVRFDEQARAYQEDKRLFFAAGTTVPGGVVLGTEGPLSPAGQAISVRFSFDRMGRKVAARDDDDDLDLIVYDGADRVLKARDAIGNETTFTYDANSNLIKKVERDIDSNRTAPIADELVVNFYFYDAMDRRTRGVDNLGNEARSGFDSRDNLTHTLDPLGNVVRFTHDGANRLVESVRDLRLTGRGHLSALDLANPANADGQIRLQLEYDDNGNLTRLTDDLGNETVYVYDAHDRLRRVSYPTGTVETYAYDRDDKVTQRTDANGSTFTTAYDSLNRPLQVAVARAASVRADDSPTSDPLNATQVRTTAVAGTTLQTFAYDGLSRLVELTDNNDPGTAADDSRCSLTYDSLSRVVAEAQTIGTTTRTVSYGWQFLNEQAQLVYPNGRTLQRTHDELDRVTRIQDAGGGAGLIASFRYMGGRVLEASHGNGTRLTYLDDAGTKDVGYDRLRRPVQRRCLRANNSQVVGFDQGYDAVSNRVFERKLHDPDQSERWSFDSAYRLTNFERGTLGTFALGQQAVTEAADKRPSISSVVRTQAWQLDGEGSWRSGSESKVEASGTTTVAFSRSTSPRHEYTQESRTTTDSSGSSTVTTKYLDDPNGNLVDDGRFVYRWDGFNRLVRVETTGGVVVARYSYDAQGRRVSKEVTAAASDPNLQGTTLFFHDGGQILEELFRGPAATQFTLMRQFTYGLTIDEPCTIDRYVAGAGSAALDASNLTTLQTSSGTRSVHRLFYARNTLGSVFALTDTASASGPDPGAHVVEAYQYDPYGLQERIRPAGSNASVQFDASDVTSIAAASQFDNPFTFTGRYFDAETGLFQYRNRYYDPTLGRFLSVDSVGFAEGMNPYQYVGGNPLNMVDPSGNVVERAVAGVGSGLFSAVTSALGTLASGGSMTDASIEAGIGFVEGFISGALTCGVPPAPPPVAMIVSSLVGSVLRTAVKHIRRMIECGAEFDIKEFLMDAAKQAIRDLIVNAAMGKVMGLGGKAVKRLAERMGMGDVLKRMSPCAKKAAATAAAFGVSKAMGPLENCFLAGTPIDTADGEAPVEEIKEGDFVYSRNQATGEVGLKRVVRVFRNTTDKVVVLRVKKVDPSAKPVPRVRGRGEIRSQEARGGGEDDAEGGATELPDEGAETLVIECTPGHPFAVRGRDWVFAGALARGDLLYGRRGEVLRVESVQLETRQARTYNFEVQDWHTYFAQGAWVHNTSKNCGGGAADTARNTPGVATGGTNLPTGARFNATLKRHGVARIPEPVARKLRGRKFKNWQDFRQEFWKAVDEIPGIRDQFSRSSQGRIAKRPALAPRVPQHAADARMGRGANSLNLDHTRDIADGGGVYDLGNIRVMTPRRHADKTYGPQ
ncbi:MAG TPA: hypothetical protein DEA08_11320 [Planctomycetes bacterium]|nr:hypothetical protein [Planctomycetota bacterium]